MTNRAIKAYLDRVYPRPRLEWRTFDEFIRRKLAFPGAATCRKCLGNKRIVAPDEVPDPIEGYKMARRVTCPLCDGTGVDPDPEHWLKEYRKAKRKHADDVKFWRVGRESRERALSKLTNEERRLLGLT